MRILEGILSQEEINKLLSGEYITEQEEAIESKKLSYEERVEKYARKKYESAIEANKVAQKRFNGDKLSADEEMLYQEGKKRLQYVQEAQKEKDFMKNSPMLDERLMREMNGEIVEPDIVPSKNLINHNNKISEQNEFMNDVNKKLNEFKGTEKRRGVIELLDAEIRNNNYDMKERNVDLEMNIKELEARGETYKYESPHRVKQEVIPPVEEKKVSFARQKKEAFEEFQKTDPNDMKKVNKSLDKIEAAEIGQKAKVEEYLENRAKRGVSNVEVLDKQKLSEIEKAKGATLIDANYYAEKPYGPVNEKGILNGKGIYKNLNGMDEEKAKSMHKKQIETGEKDAEKLFQEKHGEEAKRLTDEFIAKEKAAKKLANDGGIIKEKTEEVKVNPAAETKVEEVKAREFKSPMEKIIAETEYGPAGKTMETSGVFTEDAGKYNLKNIAEMEAKVAIEAEKANKLQIDSTSTEDAVKGKGILGGLFKKDVELVDSEFNFKSDVFKGGEVSGNYGRFEKDAKPEDISKLENIRSSLNTAKNKLLKESYVPASHGSDVHFEKGVFEKLNEMKLTEGASVEKAGKTGKGASSGAGLYLKSLGLDDKTKIEWGATEEGGLEGLYKRTTKNGVEESHKLKVNFGKDGAMSGFETQKLDGDKWVNNDAKIDLGNGQKVGIERAKEIAKMNEKQVRMDMIKQNRQAVADGVEGTKKMGTMEELKLKLGRGAKAGEAKTILENAKTAVKMHTDATDVMAKNIGGILGDVGRVDLKAISAAASGAVEGAAKEAGKNTHAMGNNTGKGMKSLLVLAGVGAAFGAVKATFDNSAEQRRQKQLELMAMRQQYGGAM